MGVLLQAVKGRGVMGLSGRAGGRESLGVIGRSLHVGGEDNGVSERAWVMDRARGWTGRGWIRIKVFDRYGIREKKD